jgi:Glyoxalase-like domain
MVTLDHISIDAPLNELRRRGLRITPTRGADGDHARVMFERTYFELRPALTGTELRGTGWFLRADNQEALRQRLLAAGIAVSEPIPYAGRDGSWVDLELPGPRPVTPIVTHRVDIAGWPPPLTAAHPNGAVAIAELHLGARNPEALTALLGSTGAEQAKAGRLRLGEAEVSVQDAGADALLSIVLRLRDGDELRLDLAGAAH